MPGNLFTFSSNKIFVIKVLALCFILVALDFTLGKGLEKIYFSQKSGKFFRTRSAIETTRADIVFFGSSRAIHHYDPRIFLSLLGVPAYNAGARGQDIVYAYSVLQGILHRYTPKIVILNLDTRIFKKEGKFERLSDLAPFYRNHPELRPIIERKSKFERVKLLSYLYTYNSTILHFLNYAIKPQLDYDGFFPLRSMADAAEMDEPVGVVPSYTDLDAEYMVFYENFLKDTLNSGAKMLIVISPGLAAAGEHAFINPAILKAKDLKIPVWDYSNDDHFVGHRELFADHAHMNETGAKLFSSLIADRLGGEYPEFGFKPTSF